MTLRLAVATEDFGEPLRRAIMLAAKNKVQGLRLNARTEVRTQDFSDTALRQLKHYVAEHRLSVAGLMYSGRHAIHDEHHLDQRLDGIRAAMTLVRKLGTSELLVRAGRIPDPVSTTPVTHPGNPTDLDVDSLRNPFSFAPAGSTQGSEDTSEAKKFQLLCDILNDLVRYGSRYGAELQLQVSSFELPRIQHLLRNITGGAIGIVFDPATCVMTGSSPVQIFRDAWSHIGYVRLRDARNGIDGGGIEVEFGEGAVDWIELLPTIVDANLPTWVCVERTGGEQRDQDVRVAIQRIERMLPTPH